MRIAILLSTLVIVGSTSQAQLINGSFEDALGNYSDSGWVSTCSPVFGPAAPGWGNSGSLVPHSNAPGCGWSRLYQFVPSIADGETWTLSGWCFNFTWFWADPYIGFRFGVKDALGNLSFNTAALMNTGTWTHLSVTNSFALAPGDTVFVECDPGSVSGAGTNQVFATFDGVELTAIPTGLSQAASAPQLIMRPDPVVDRLWVAWSEPLIEVKAVSTTGAMRPVPFGWNNGTAEVDVDALAPGAYVLWARTASAIATARFVKH